MRNKIRLVKLEKIMGYKNNKTYVIIPDLEGIKRVSVSDGTRMTFEEFEALNVNRNEVIEIEFV